MLNIQYFAYGSNISIERLRSRVETVFEPLAQGTPYVLNNYKLVFNAGAMYGAHCYANIVPQQGESVEGILYNITPEQLSTLDRFEVLYNKHFFYLNNTTIGCVYIAKPEHTERKPKKPTLEYLNIIIDGCKETGLNRTYNQLLQYKLKNYKIRKNKHKIFFDDSINIQRRNFDVVRTNIVSQVAFFRNNM